MFLSAGGEDEEARVVWLETGEVEGNSVDCLGEVEGEVLGV